MQQKNTRLFKNHLKTIEQICAEKNIRFTPVRKTLAKLIYISERPVSAYDLLKSLKSIYPNAEAMTVYRALEFLSELGVVHKLAGSRTYTRCAHPDKQHYGHLLLLLCQNCGKGEEIEELKVIKPINAVAKQHRFVLLSQTIELLGLCNACDNA